VPEGAALAVGYPGEERVDVGVGVADDAGGDLDGDAGRGAGVPGAAWSVPGSDLSDQSQPRPFGRFKIFIPNGGG
jgi:hypothetical protein